MVVNLGETERVASPLPSDEGSPEKGLPNFTLGMKKPGPDSGPGFVVLVLLPLLYYSRPRVE